MLEKLKTHFYSFLLELGYNITDNGNYEEHFPWLILRTNGYSVLNSFNMKVGKATLVLDIFSQYQGEKEIIQIIENIEEHLIDFIEMYPDVLYGYQKGLKILDDNNTGIVKKHGVASYEFLLGEGLVMEEQEDDGV